MEAQNGRKSGKMRRMSAINEDGINASRKRQLENAGGTLYCWKPSSNRPGLA